MKVLMLSTDPRVFEEGSAVSARLLAYGQLTDGIYVLVSAGSVRHSSITNLSTKVTLASVSGGSRLLRVFYLLRAGFALRAEGFSLITAQDPFETGFVGALLSVFLKAPLEVQIHTDFLSPYFVRHSGLNRLRLVLASLVLPRARIVRTVSERIRKSVLARYRLSPERVVVLPIINPSVEISSEKIGFKDRYPDFTSLSLAVSRFEPEKNLPALLDAFAEVSHTERAAALVLVGEGSGREALERRARMLGIEQRVFFEGWQRPEPYFREADLFVQNSLYEGYGLTLIEAAQVGCPILTTDVGIVGEVITEENATVVPAGDTRALARAWQTALENPQFVKEKAERAQEAVKRHIPLTPEAYAEAIVGLWRKACA